MFSVSSSVVINKPVGELFAFASDFNNLPKWQGSVTYVEAPAGTITRGYQYINVRKFMGQEIRTPFEVLEVIPNSSFSLKSTGGPVKVQVSIGFEPVQAGTRMTTNLQMEVNGVFKVAEGVVARQMKTQIGEDGQVLKELMEKK
jgi:uncharacterized membrane protein